MNYSKWTSVELKNKRKELLSSLGIKANPLNDYISKDALVFASKYKERDIIKGEEFTMYECECIKCGYKSTSESHCKDVVCPECQGTMRRVERPGPGQNANTGQVTCSNCEAPIEVELNERIGDYLKCPGCKSLLDNTGEVKYPPQKANFNLTCTNCGSNNWLEKINTKTDATIECITCKQNYKLDFKQTTPHIFKLNILANASASCPQCGNVIATTYVGETIKALKCPECGLHFNLELKDMNGNTKTISKITQIEKKSIIKSEEEESKMEIPKEVVERVVASADAKLEDVVESTKPEQEVKESDNDKSVKEPEASTEEKDEPTSEVEAEVVVEEVVEEPVIKEEVEAVVEEVVEDEEEVEAVVDEEEEDVKAEIAKLKEMVKLSAKRTVRATKALNLAMAESKEKRAKTAKKLSGLKKKYTDLVIAFDEKINYFKENAKEIISKREELGVYAEDLSDTDIMNEDKFEIASLRKERDELKLESLNEVDEDIEVASIVGEHDDEYYANLRKKVDEVAYGGDRK